MAEEKKYIGVETDLLELVRESVQAFMSKCANSAEYLSKKNDERWESVTNPPEDVKDRVMATGCIALTMCEAMSKDQSIIREIAELVVEKLADSKGRDLTPDEEERYVRPTADKPDVMYG